MSAAPQQRTTDFVLTEDQERDLVEYALQRIDGLRVDNKDRMDADRKAWEWHNNRREARKVPGSVFEDSNLVLPLTSMIDESFISRAEDEVTGSDPFFRFRPRGTSDVEKAKEHNAYFSFKFGPEGANVKATFENAYEAIFIQRAAVFKVIWKDHTADWLDGSTKILVDKKSGAPIKKLTKGKPGYVTEDSAKWVEKDEPGPDSAVINKSVLEDDPSIVWDDSMEFTPPPKALLRQQVIYRGAKASLLDYDAFLCPSNAPSIEEADFKAELYDKSLSWVKGMFLARPWMTWREFSGLYRTAKAKGQTETERNKESKETLDFDDKTRTLKLYECWVRRDVLGWGKPQEFMLIIEPDKKKAVYYEFQANVSADLQCAFVGIAIAPHKGRWWGYGLPEKIEQFQEFADKQFNRAAARNALNANPLGGIQPDAAEDEPDELELGKGGLWRLKAGKTIQDLVGFAEIPDLDDRTIELLNFVIRMLQLWLAVSNISQGDYSDTPENNTKYGIQATLREASKLGRRWIRRIIRGFEAVLRKMVKLQANNLDQAEAFELLEGDSALLKTMTPDQIRSVDLDVALVLGTQLTEMEIEAAKQALEVQQQYFAIVDPTMQLAARPLFERILEALDYDNIDQLLPKPIIPPPGMMPGAVPGVLPPAGAPPVPAAPAAAA